MFDFLANYRKYGPRPSTHDIAKAVAIIIMIVDHLGRYFFPEMLWLRAIGRIGFPVWFFLAGYAKPGRTGSEIYMLSAAMIAADVAVAETILPLNALVSVLVCRALVNWLAAKAFPAWNVFAILLAVLMWHPVTMFLFEYGSLALMYAVAGYLCRSFPGSPAARAGMAAAGVIFIAMQQMNYQFSLPQFAVMALGTVLVTAWLSRFRVMFYDPAGWQALAKPVMFIARNSLYIYALHVIAFEVTHYFLDPPAVWGIHWTKLEHIP